MCILKVTLSGKRETISRRKRRKQKEGKDEGNEDEQENDSEDEEMPDESPMHPTTVTNDDGIFTVRVHIRICMC